MENILKKICKDKKVFIEKEKKKKNINFLIKNTSKTKKVRDFKKAFDKVLKKGNLILISSILGIQAPKFEHYQNLKM